MTDIRELISRLLEVAECYSDGRETYEPFEQILREARSYLNADRRPILTSTSPTDEELCELYKKAYYESVDRQGPAAQAAALRAVLERWGK